MNSTANSRENKWNGKPPHWGKTPSGEDWLNEKLHYPRGDVKCQSITNMWVHSTSRCPRKPQSGISATSPPFMDPIACQGASAMLLETKRTEPSNIEVFTPPVCRLLAALRCCVPVAAGIAGSLVTWYQPLRIISGDEVFGVSSVWKRKTPSSL